MNWAERVLARLDQTNVQESLRVASRDIVADMGERIFQKGLNSNGQSIGDYSSKPTYISKDKMPRIVSGTRQADKTVFFQGGYRQFKQQLGSSDVNWRVFGNLMRDFMSPGESLQGNTIKFSVKNSENADKLTGLRKKFDRNGKVTDLTANERETLNETFVFELRKRIFENNAG